MPSFKRHSLRNLFILVLPFILMIFINEAVRIQLAPSSFIYKGVKTMNSNKKLKDQCSWACHSATKHCTQNHLKFDQRFLPEKIYHYVIDLLKKTKNYQLANVFFLVVLIPLGIWFFIVQSLHLQDKISSINQSKRHGNH